MSLVTVVVSCTFMWFIFPSLVLPGYEICPEGLMLTAVYIVCV